MSEKLSYVIARLTIGKDHFEVLVNPDAAWQMKRGKPVSISDVLISNEVYKDSKKGLKASQEVIKSAFKTLDLAKIVETIIRRGEIQLTAQQRKQLIDAKRKQIVEFIAKNCIDPKTGMPHPPLRIENALNEVKLQIDPFEDPKEQAMNVIHAIKPILPIKISQALLALKVPAIHASRVYGVLPKFGVIKRSAWGPDGSWIGEVEIPAGLQPALIDKLNSITRGNVEVKILRR